MEKTHLNKLKVITRLAMYEDSVNIDTINLYGWADYYINTI